jgi:hypothetical protein
MKKLLWLGLAGLVLCLSGCALFFSSDGEALYEETFSDPTSTAWHVGSTSTSDKWIDGGKYYMLVKEAIMALGYNQVEGPFDNVQIDLDVDHILGTPDKSGGGLLFRIQDPDNMYGFLVSAAGTFCVGKWGAGTWNVLINWTSSTAVNKGVARNHLTVVANGGALSFLVNDTQVAMLTDQSFPWGRVGTAARAFDADVDVLQGFDNLVVRTVTD